MTGVAWDSAQNPARVSFAPPAESVDVLLALVLPPLGFTEVSSLETSWEHRRARASSTEQLAAVVPAAASSTGLAYDSSQSRALVSWAPRHGTVDVLLAVESTVLPWTEQLNSPAVFSRYTIITPEQEDVATILATELPPPGPFGEWFVSSAMRSRYRRATAYQEDAVLHAEPLPMPEVAVDPVVTVLFTEDATPTSRIS